MPRQPSPTRLSTKALESSLGELPGWSVADNMLTYVYPAPSYIEGVSALNAIAQLAEAADHHPEMVLAYRQLTIRFWTHTAEGITALDIAMAKQVSQTLLSRKD